MRHLTTISSFVEIELDAASVVLSDLDGCLISGRHVHEGARDFVRACGSRLWIVSNNSSDTAVTLSERLLELDLDIDPRRILLAGEESVRRLAASADAKSAIVYADAPLRALAARLGIACADCNPAAVLLARDQRFGLAMAEEIAGHVISGAELFVANLDLSHPAATGFPVPETGALLATVQACTGPVAVRSIGKPATDLIEIALRRSGAERCRALFVGDNDATDGEAARAAGIGFHRILHPALAVGPAARHAINGRESLAC